MKNKYLPSFTNREKLLWLFSCSTIILSFLFFNICNIITLAASLIGVTAIILNAKGTPLGQALMIIFSLLYGIISYDFKYYGEMLTYLGMTMPMAAAALVSWIKNPYKGNKSETAAVVAVNRISLSEWWFLAALSLAVTALFYFVLKIFGTANIIPSTVSVTTSFIAVYLTFRRSPYFSLGYAANDIVLIILWALALKENSSYLSVLICFVMFWINDIYAFFAWRKMEKLQHMHAAA